MSWRRDRLLTPEFLGFPCGSAGKESTCNSGDPSSIPESGRPTEEGISCPLQYSGLENSTDCIVHGVAKSQTQLRDFHFFTFFCSYFLDLLWCLVLLFNLWPHPEACGISVLCPGIEPALPALEGRVLTTGPLGKSLLCF